MHVTALWFVSIRPSGRDRPPPQLIRAPPPGSCPTSRHGAQGPARPGGGVSPVRVRRADLRVSFLSLPSLSRQTGTVALCRCAGCNRRVVTLRRLKGAPEDSSPGCPARRSAPRVAPASAALPWNRTRGKGGGSRTGRHEPAPPPGGEGHDQAPAPRPGGRKLSAVTARLAPSLVVGRISPGGGCPGPR
jgi:hypothetical protein